MSHHWLIFHSGETLGNKEHEAGLEGPKVGSQWRLTQLINKNECTLDKNPRPPAEQLGLWVGKQLLRLPALPSRASFMSKEWPRAKNCFSGPAEGNLGARNGLSQGGLVPPAGRALDQESAFAISASCFSPSEPGLLGPFLISSFVLGSWENTGDNPQPLLAPQGSHDPTGGLGCPLTP